MPADGVYTFYATREFTFPDNACGYDPRVFVDGKEWYPAIRWQAHGTWSVALANGKHALLATYVDARLKPHKIELLWGFPHPDFTWKGLAPALDISAHGLPRQPLPDAMLCHTP